MRWFSLESPVVERKYVFTSFKGENDLSLTALVAGMTFPGCSLLRIVSSTTPVSVSLVHGFTHDKSVKSAYFQLVWISFLAALVKTF